MAFFLPMPWPRCGRSFTRAPRTKCMALSTLHRVHGSECMALSTLLQAFCLFFKQVLCTKCMALSASHLAPWARVDNNGNIILAWLLECVTMGWQAMIGFYILCHSIT